MIFLEIFSFITTLSIFGYAKIADNIPVAEPFIIWILCGLAVLICGKIFFSKQISHYIIISYSLLSILGLIQALSYYSSYQYFFAPFFDDSYYFFNVHKIYSGFTFSESTLYEKILVLPVFILDMLSMERESFLALLPANWMFGAFVVGLSLNLAKYLIPEKDFTVSLLAFLAVMGNSLFIDTSIHLYRDIFMLFFFLLSVTFALKNRWFISLLFCFLIGYIRSSNALLLLFFISLLFILSAEAPALR